MAQILEGQLSAEGYSLGIVVSRFNGLVTNQLLTGALDCLKRHGTKDSGVTVVYCPGAFELPQITLQLANSGKFDALICLGCVIRGETPHFDYIAKTVADGLNRIALDTNVPLAFGVLTTETLEQALERAGAKAGNKGWDAALTALELVNLRKQLSEGRKRSRN